ncbi:hypothetical protein XANCAGTX0491_005577 [Xanthoria calcicola]
MTYLTTNISLPTTPSRSHLPFKSLVFAQLQVTHNLAKALCIPNPKYTREVKRSPRRNLSLSSSHFPRSVAVALVNISVFQESIRQDTHRQQRSKTHCYNPHPIIYDPDTDSTPIAAAVDGRYPPSTGKPISPIANQHGRRQDGRKHKDNHPNNTESEHQDRLFNEGQRCCDPYESTTLSTTVLATTAATRVIRKAMEMDKRPVTAVLASTMKDPRALVEEAISEIKALRAEMQLLREAILELKDETGEAMPMRILLLQGPFQLCVVRSWIWSGVAYALKSMKYRDGPGWRLLDDAGLRLQ